MGGSGMTRDRSRLIKRVGGVLVCLCASYVLSWMLYWPATWPARGIQQPLYYNETYVWPMPWTLHQAAPGVPPPAPLTLYPGDVARQDLRASADNLAAIRVWLAGELGGEEVSVALGDTEGRGAVYAARFRLDAGGEGRTYLLRLPAIADAQGHEYTLRLHAVEGTMSTRVGYVDRIPGQLRLNEFPSPGDLDIGVYHRGRPGIWTVRALAERALPSLLRSRVRQYKPAPLKGATFGVLCLALAAGVGLLLWAMVPPPANQRRPALATARTIGSTLVGLLLAGAIAFRWDVAGMIGLGRKVTLVENVGSSEHKPGPSIRDLTTRLAFVERKPEPRQVSTRFVTLEGRRRACIAVPANAQITYGLRPPFDGELRLGMALPDGATQPLTFQVQVAGAVLLERTLTPAESGRWHDVTLALPYAGLLTHLTLTTHPAGLPLEFTSAPGGGPAPGGPLPVAGLWADTHVMSARSWLSAYPPAEPPQVTQVAHFGQPPAIELLGYDVTNGCAASTTAQGTQKDPPLRLRLTLYWRALRPVHVPYTVFVHLLDERGDIRGQWDSQPLGGTYPTDVWPADVVIRDEVVVVSNGEGAPPGEVRLAVGLYKWDTLERLPAYDEKGEPWPDGRVLLAPPDVLYPPEGLCPPNSQDPQ